MLKPDALSWLGNPVDLANNAHAKTGVTVALRSKLISGILCCCCLEEPLVASDPRNEKKRKSTHRSNREK